MEKKVFGFCYTSYTNYTAPTIHSPMLDTKSSAERMIHVIELKTARLLKEEMDGHAAKLELLRGNVIKVRAMDGLPGAKTVDSVVEKLVVAIDDEQRILDELKEKFADAVVELFCAISDNVQNPAEFEVLLLRYVRCLTFNEIIRTMNYSDSHVFKLHRDGCKHYRESAVNQC